MKDKPDSPARDKIRSAYDLILHEGREEGMKKGFWKAAFQTFKKGLSMGLPMADLITLTEVSEATAQAWHVLLQADPEAEWPGL